jgi:TolB protein
VDVISRRIADDIVEAFTGRPGMASTEIAFISDRNGPKEVFVMNADGGDVRAATSNRSINAFPDWAPGGNEIVYTSYRHGGQPTLFLLTRGRRKPGRLLTRVDDGAPIYRGVFNPDGNRLAFVRSVNGAPEIFTSRRDGRSLRRLTSHRAIDISPSWSPDAERLAFVSDRSGAPQVYVMDADGGNVRRLTFNGSYNTSPAWSPDGAWIAYESRVGGQFDIWLIDPEGRTNVPVITHPRSDESPSWSPDGRWLAFSSTRRGRADIYTVSIDGSNVRRLTSGGGNNTSPSWGPHPGRR